MIALHQNVANCQNTLMFSVAQSAFFPDEQTDRQTESKDGCKTRVHLHLTGKHVAQSTMYWIADREANKLQTPFTSEEQDVVERLLMV